ncbi:hypothetical protein T07_7001 [Trichinella nelsoni]|uniref:Uncharacterized protein n=1 Tax=Trichinella nelsoni TaxID=6336 RepID=A0A0V0SAP6_9BILA|nr:hypothetical protein T07_7001 [Trichinella nelsoni]
MLKKKKKIMFAYLILSVPFRFAVETLMWNFGIWSAAQRSQNAISTFMQCAIACIVEPVVSLLISRVIRLELSNISILRHPSHHRPMLSSLSILANFSSSIELIPGYIAAVYGSLKISTRSLSMLSAQLEE